MGAAIALKSVSPVKVEDRKKLDIRAGDVVRIHQKIKEKGKTRLQVFEGLVLARKHGTEAGATFTVRAVLQGIGVEKIFPLYSPMIDKIEIVRRSKVRRAKLYYIRDKVAREQRRQLRKMTQVSVSSTSDADDQAEAAAAETAPIEAAQPTAEELKAEVTSESEGATEAT